MADSILDLGFSRLAVGTVQFGLPYGVANRVGQPSYREVREILACAMDNGVNTLDTAAAYGESEEVVGRALRELDAREQVIVITKVRHLTRMPEPRTRANVERWIRDSVVSSLARLGLDSVPVCLFHNFNDVAYMDILRELRDEGLVQHTGASLSVPRLV